MFKRLADKIKTQTKPLRDSGDPNAWESEESSAVGARMRRGWRRFTKFIGGILGVVWKTVSYWFRKPWFRWFVFVGIPLFALITTLTLLLAFPNLLPRRWLIERYVTEANAATKAGRQQEAQLLLRKLVELDPNRALFRYRLALNMATEQPQQAFEMMNEIAPDSSLGFPPAHLWQAMIWLRADNDMLEKWGLNSAERLPRIRHHCNMVLQANPRDLEARVLLAETQALQDPREAIATLLPIAQDDPKVMVRITQLYEVLGDSDQAKKTILDLSSSLVKRMSSPPYSNEDVGMLVAAYIDTGNHEAAFEWLEARKLDLSQEVYVGGVSTIYASKAKELLKNEDKESFENGLRFLTLAFRTSPNNPVCYQVLADHLASDNERVLVAINLCEQLIAESRAGTPVYVILGTMLLTTGQNERAESYFEQAYALEPQSVMVLNNLAWLLAHKPEPDFVRAEQLIDEAVKVAPRSADVRDTRGTILMLNGRFSEALTEFQLALQESPDNPQFLEHCAEAYERMGDVEQAKAFRERVDTLTRGGNQ